MDLTSLTWLVKIAAVSTIGGLVGSISGLGGGIVIVPVLTLFLGFPIQDAIGASIVSVIAVSSGAGSVYVRDRITNVRIAMFLELSTAAGALFGASFLSTFFNPQVLSILFGLTLLISLAPVAVKMGEELPQGVRNDQMASLLSLNGDYFDKRLNRNIPYNVTGIPAAMGLMAVCVDHILGLDVDVGRTVFSELASDRACTTVQHRIADWMRLQTDQVDHRAIAVKRLKPTGTKTYCSRRDTSASSQYLRISR